MPSFLQKSSLCAAGLVILSGCGHFATPPAPKPAVPNQWQQSTNAPDGHNPPQEWWLAFNDPVLNQLIEKTLHNNTDRRLAIARIHEARAVEQYAEAQKYPIIDLAAATDYAHNRSRSGSGGSTATGTTSSSGRDTAFSAGFDASWELDLFGRLEQQAIAARAETKATTADSQAVTLSMIAEVTRQYTLYRLYQQQEKLASDNTAAQQAILKVTEARYNQGVEDKLAVTRARTLLETTQGQIPYYQSAAQVAAYDIDYLVGAQPGANKDLLTAPAPVPLIMQDVILQTPLTVIQRRPDIVAAQQRVVEQTALKNSTIDELYPTITLSAGLGLTAGTLGGLGNSNNLGESLGGSVLAPLFDFGRIRADINASKARQEEAEIVFEQTVLGALRDIESAANTYLKAKERYASLDKASQDGHTAVGIAQLQYKEGILSQLDVLEAEQTAYNADANAKAAAADLTQDFVALCKALALMPDDLLPPSK